MATTKSLELFLRIFKYASSLLCFSKSGSSDAFKICLAKLIFSVSMAKDKGLGLNAEIQLRLAIAAAESLRESLKIFFAQKLLALLKQEEQPLSLLYLIMLLHE